VERPRVRRRSFVTESHREIASPPEVLLNTILAPATWPRWQSEILSTNGNERLSTGDVVSGRARLLGFEVDGSSTAIEIQDSSYEQDVIVGVKMRVRYEINPSSNGAVVKHRLASDLPAGVSGRVLSFFLTRRLRRMQRDLLKGLAAQTESVERSSS
jgi:Polyketide cyclase / dehydrase and lipid transport